VILIFFVRGDTDTGAGDAGAEGGAGTRDTWGAEGDVDAEVFFATVILNFFFSRGGRSATAKAGGAATAATAAATSGFAIETGGLGL